MTKAAELAKMGEVLTNSQIGGRRNLVINGAMQVAQRGTSSTGLGAASGYFTLDRFNMVENDASAGRFTMTQSTITDLSGFANGLKIDCTTADTSIAAGEALFIQQRLEGQDVQSLTATSTTTNAFTVSFYARSNASRAIALEVRFANGTNRQASTLHTIGTSFQRVTMTVPAASSTQIDNDNSAEMDINIWLHGGSTFTSGTITGSSLGAATNANRAVGIGSIFASTDNTFEMTGLQVEVGSQATSFEHRSFGEELLLCQRYFNRRGQTQDLSSGYDAWATGTNIASTVTRIAIPYPVAMRAKPTLSTNGNISMSGGSSFSSIASNYASLKSGMADLSVSGGTSGYGHLVYSQNSSNDYFDLDSEM